MAPGFGWRSVPDIDDLRVKNKMTRLLWHSNYYDGPISGFMFWYGQKAWFNMYDDMYEHEPMEADEVAETIAEFERDGLPWDESDLVRTFRYRLYNVYEITDQQIEDLEYNHKLFIDIVGGSNCEYGDDGMRTRQGEVKPGFKDYYDNEKTKKREVKIDLSAGKIIGQFRR